MPRSWSHRPACANGAACAKGDELVLAIGLIYNGLEEVVRSLRLLPEHVHLALVGRLHPPSYQAKIAAMLEEPSLGRGSICSIPCPIRSWPAQRPGPTSA